MIVLFVIYTNPATLVSWRFGDN